MEDSTNANKRSFSERLAGDGIICAGGYLFEMERRGYLAAGEFVPEVALEHPEVLEQVTRDFIRAGSDVALAFTYNGHREKMRIIGKEEMLEPLNRAALKSAKKVAAEKISGEEALVAGNISNTNIFDPNDEGSKKEVRRMFEEMVGWAKEEGVDFILAETLYFKEEAEIALDVIKQAGLPAVIMTAAFADGGQRDCADPVQTCRELHEKGADVVGMNCFRGPQTSYDLMGKIVSAIDGPVGSMPVAFRTTNENPTFFNLPDHCCPIHIPYDRTFPTALEAQVCNRYEMYEYAKTMKQQGVKFMGVCCGGSVIHHRAVAEAWGRNPYLSKYSPRMEKHFMYGNDPSLKKHIQEIGSEA